jgi:hypothetical protein
MVELNKATEVKVVKPLAVTAVATLCATCTAEIKRRMVDDDAKIPWPTSPAPHVAEMELILVVPPAVETIPSVPVERTEAEVPPLESEPLFLSNQEVILATSY